MTSLDSHTTRPQARRQDLLGQLVTLVLAEGFADVTLDELARRLRCSRSTLYGPAAIKERWSWRR